MGGSTAGEACMGVGGGGAAVTAGVKLGVFSCCAPSLLVTESMLCVSTCIN